MRPHDKPPQKTKLSELIAAYAAVAAVIVSLIGAVINVQQTREVSVRQQRMAQQTGTTQLRVVKQYSYSPLTFDGQMVVPSLTTRCIQRLQC
jgi:hypothetical protein